VTSPCKYTVHDVTEFFREIQKIFFSRKRLIRKTNDQEVLLNSSNEHLMEPQHTCINECGFPLTKPIWRWMKIRIKMPQTHIMCFHCPQKYILGKAEEEHVNIPNYQLKLHITTSI
jgi:hypothetical protein